jgi:hypothetical protein
MRKKYSLVVTIIVLALGWNFAPANAIFGLSVCEKVKKQAQSDQAVIKSLAKSQAELIKKRDAGIAKLGYQKLPLDPDVVNDEEIKFRTLAAYRKILSSFQNLQKNQECLKPDKYADVLYLVESYKKAVKLWSSPRAPYLTGDLIQYGDLKFYLK